MRTHDEFPEESGASTGDRRENDPDAAGFTPEHDRLFRSHFQHVNQLADRGYDQVQQAYLLGYRAAGDPGYDGKQFAEVEKELENGWLSVRTSTGEWASVRDLAEEAFRVGRGQGRVTDMPAAGTTDSHDRASFSDPLAGGVDPTSVDAPSDISND